MKSTFTSFITILIHSEGGNCSVHGNNGTDSTCEMAIVQKPNLLKDCWCLEVANPSKMLVVCNFNTMLYPKYSVRCVNPCEILTSHKGLRYCLEIPTLNFVLTV